MSHLVFVVSGFLLAVLVLLLIRGDAWSAPVGDEPVAYAQDIEPVVRNYCATCHHGDEPQGGFTLDTYDEVRSQTDKGSLLKRIHDAKDPMPPSGLLPIHHRRLFRKWADGGYRKTRKGGTRKRLEPTAEIVPPEIEPVDVRKQGFDFLERMQGHWVGSMHLMGQDHEWMSFDYRAIGPAHVHGIFEGGSMGNLFTSWFVADLEGTRTIMARNGGLLNGIYRTSYFVLEDVADTSEGRRFRFVDAHGGARILWMDVTFHADTIRFRSYTSRMGLQPKPTLHMDFQGQRRTNALADAAAKAVGFPKSEPAFSFPKGLPAPDWGPDYKVTSASYMWEDKQMDLVALAKRARDPIRIDQIPYIAQLAVQVKRGAATRGAKLMLLLSQEPLVDKRGRLRGEGGYLGLAPANTILSFPELSPREDAFTFTYLHPGTYYLSVVADKDGDSYPGPGDVTHPLRTITIKPGAKQKVVIDDLKVVN